MTELHLLYLYRSFENVRNKTNAQIVSLIFTRFKPGFKPSSKIFFTDRSKAVPFLCGSFVFYVSMFSCLFIAVLWSPAGKGLNSWLLLAIVGDVYCIFVTFPCGILGQMWYLIVSFPDLCHLSYLYKIIVGGSLKA